MSGRLGNLPPHRGSAIPAAGWKPNTYYVVEVSMRATNPIWHAILFTGFLNERGEPGAYSGILRTSIDETIRYRDVFFIAAVHELATERAGEIHPNRSDTKCTTSA